MKQRRRPLAAPWLPAGWPPADGFAARGFAARGFAAQRITGRGLTALWFAGRRYAALWLSTPWFATRRCAARAAAALWLAALFAGVLPGAATADEPWQRLPPTPAVIPTDRQGALPVDGISLHYAIYGHGSPVVFLHGGLANSDYWGRQVPALAARHTVILLDSRGHGRSSRDRRPFGYDLMADDVVAALDRLHVGRADIVGWSDGAIIGLDLALRHRERIGRVFAFAANTRTDGVKPDTERNPTFARFIRRAGAEYARQSRTPGQYTQFVAQISRMWADQPNWSDAALRGITTPVLIADGDHDEAIVRTHTEYIAATIPGAGLLILPRVSHFAFLQDPAQFNFAVLHFLGDE